MISRTGTVRLIIRGKNKYIMQNFSSEVEAADYLKNKYHDFEKEIRKVIVGQQQVVRELLISIFSNGHCLLIGVPGLAKTLLVNTVAKILGLEYNRIQFTPDLMPSDIIGTEILGNDRQFKFVKGPIFANFILADEINRTPPKTQSALLEAMQEKAVTAAGTRYKLPQPFFVLATQNPIEQEGTYPLPEAQLDRFMFNIIVNYPSADEEKEIVKQTTIEQNISLSQILSKEEIQFFQKLIQHVPVNENVINYAVSLVTRTRPNFDNSPDFINNYVSWGAGPRASQYLIIAAKTNAVLSGKYSPDIEDIQTVAFPILRHRIIRNYKAEAENITIDELVKKLF